MRFILVLSLLPLVGCGDPDIVGLCHDYILSINSCVETAWGDKYNKEKMALTDSFCDSYVDATGAQADEYVTLFECYTDAIDNTDCTTEAGLDVADAVRQVCGT
jgi:hypothetical protein